MKDERVDQVRKMRCTGTPTHLWQRISLPYNVCNESNPSSVCGCGFLLEDSQPAQKKSSQVRKPVSFEGPPEGVLSLS